MVEWSLRYPESSSQLAWVNHSPEEFPLLVAMHMNTAGVDDRLDVVKWPRLVNSEIPAPGLRMEGHNFLFPSYSVIFPFWKPISLP